MIAKTQPVHSFRVRAISKKKTQFEVSHYLIGHRIGRGGYSVVHQAVEKLTNADLAVKIIDLSLFSTNQVARLRQEVEILRNVDHPNIVRIYELIEEDSKFYIFMELIKGQQLFQYVLENGPLPEPKVTKIFFQICQAVKYLHSQGIVHRDIKTENIVVDTNFNAKLADFGLAKRFNLQSRDLFSTICGSPSYISPQLLAKRRYDGQKVDIWCLGVTLFVMLEAKLPFDQDGVDKTNQNISMMAWDKPEISSAEAIQIYESVFVRQSERPNIDDMLDSSLFRKYNRVGIKIQNKTEIKEWAIERTADLLNQAQTSVQDKVNGRQLGPAQYILKLSEALQNETSFLKPKKQSKQQKKGARVMLNSKYSRNWLLRMSQDKVIKDKKQKESRHRNESLEIEIDKQRDGKKRKQQRYQIGPKSKSITDWQGYVRQIIEFEVGGFT